MPRIAGEVDTDVLIVGGGPVGLSLAGDLGWRGIRCLLVEQTDGVIGQPKMDGINVRTMEFCRRWGITGDIRNCGYPKDYPQDMVYLTSFNGYELGREEFATPSGGSEERRLGTSPESRFRCPQDLFDPILQKFARGRHSRIRARLRGCRHSRAACGAPDAGASRRTCRVARALDRRCTGREPPCPGAWRLIAGAEP